MFINHFVQHFQNTHSIFHVKFEKSYCVKKLVEHYVHSIEYLVNDCLLKMREDRSLNFRAENKRAEIKLVSAMKSLFTFQPTFTGKINIDAFYVNGFFIAPECILV